jgi:hypothetical protein
MMQKLLSTSTATRPTGSPPQRRLFKVPSGVFAGRLLAFYGSTSNAIAYKYSDNPYESWSAEQVIVNDSSDLPFSAWMDNDGNAFIAYVDTNHYLKMLKMTFSGGAWNASQTGSILNVDHGANPFILKDSDGILWCFFDHHQISGDYRHYVRVKSSLNDGAMWGSGPGDLGTQLSSAWVDQTYISACQNFGELYVVYCSDNANLFCRVYDIAGSTWGTEQAIAAISGINDDFDIAPSADRKIGVAFVASSTGKVYLKEYDDLAWSGLIEIENAVARSPQIAYLENTPHIIYSRLLGNNYYSLRHAAKSGNSFTLSEFSSAAGTFDKVFVFSINGSPQYQDRTSAAASPTASDVFHSSSQGLLDSPDDCLYLGKLSKFCIAAIILSTPGTGGTVVWEYYNGLDWIAFTPDTGAYHFDSADKLLYLWQDPLLAPSDWQLGTVNGTSVFWIRARVLTGFATNPIGTQIVAGSKNDDLVLVR